MNSYIDKEIYKRPYSLLPNLKKLENEPVFINSETFNYIEEKKEAIKKNKCFYEHEIDQKTYDVVCDFISSETKIQKDTFEKMALQLQEDIAIHKVTKTKDWLAACHICFPSGWKPEEKIGKSFDEIHEPIPGMNLKNSKSIARSMVYNGPFVRFVWGLCYAKKLSTHPSIPYPKFDPKNPKVFIKIERQVTYGFPEVECTLFVIRQEIIEEEIDYKSLYKTCLGMTEDQRRYKSISKECMNWLSKHD